MKRGVLFDLDSTLCDSETDAHKLGMDALYSSYNEGYTISKEDFDNLFKLSRAEIKREHKGLAASHERLMYIQRMIEKTHNTVIPELILKHYHSYWDTLIENLKPIPNAVEVLRKLKEKGIKTAIVSNLTSYVQFRKIIKLGISDGIDYLITSQEAGAEKPHPSIFLFALKKLNLLPQDVVMVGDSLETDVEGANATGIDSIWLYTPRPNYENLVKEISPLYTINDLNEILYIIGIN